MKILVLGASGTIGNAVYQRLSGKHDVCGTYNKRRPANIEEKHLYKYDCADCVALDNILNNVNPDLVISSLTGNFEHQLVAHKHIAEYLKKSSGRCIFLSSANVFDGTPDTAHVESDIPYPISQYGKFKYSCEQLIQSHLENQSLIIRLPRTLSSEDALNEVQQIENGQPIFANLYMSYNTVSNVAKAILPCIETNIYGILHLTSDDFISVDEYMKMLFLKYNKNPSYTASLLTAESYCSLLGCNDPALLRYNKDGNFYLTLKSINTDLFSNFSLSCENVVVSL